MRSFFFIISFLFVISAQAEPILNGKIEITKLLDSENIENGKQIVYFNERKLELTLNPGMQKKAHDILEKYQVPWGAIVAVEPSTGKVLAMHSYSSRQPPGVFMLTKSDSPSASLFKMITAAAAIEQKGLKDQDTISFRGGNYTLGYSNYLPNSKLDRRSMTVGEAMGRSVNPVFARIALNYLSIGILERYANQFGFNERIPFDFKIESSVFTRPTDEYEFARTAAGFGDVFINPLHAAMIGASIANKGVMMKPYMINKISKIGGPDLFNAVPKTFKTVVSVDTAKELTKMMLETTDGGTARNYLSSSPLMIAGKTGTLNGENPKGTYHWFVGFMPANNANIAVATLVVDPGGARVKSTALARAMFTEYLSQKGIDWEEPPVVIKSIRKVPKFRKRLSPIKVGRNKQTKSTKKSKGRKR